MGGMVGLERTIIPQFAESEFGMTSLTGILSFITAFGITKAITNYFTGRLSNKLGRKNLLILGWLVAIPIPFLLMHASNWNWVILANICLGISQGLTWSTTVVMKIDLVGERNRGLAMGLNEFSGYLAVGLVAFISGLIANRYGISPFTFYIGIFISVIGLLLTILFVQDTRKFVKSESKFSIIKPLENIFTDTTFTNKTLSSVTQAGLINNLNDGMIWGLMPLMLSSLEFDISKIGLLTAIYPTVWGIGQLFTGKMSDIYSKKKMLFWGMLLQGIAIFFLAVSSSFLVLACFAILLGIGTALVYPTFLTTIASVTTPHQRAESIGVFRLWRDLGYAFGAIISGIIADLYGINQAIAFIAMLTILSALVIKFRMPASN